MQFTLIVPPKIEAMLGLMIGAGERVVRGITWRVELWPGEYPRIIRNGERLAIDQAPQHAIRLALAVQQAFGPVKSAD